jgi:hypothetical protein
MSFKGFYATVIVLWLVSLMNCRNASTQPQTTINTEPFIAMAKKVTVCSERANKLFAIDDSLVFWQREGDCNDAAYFYTLFGDDTGKVFCMLYDSKAGLTENVYDSTFLSLFHTITSNLTKAVLGLSADHTVIQIYF